MLIEVNWSNQVKQGDQIGRIFAPCAIVFFEQFFEKYRSSHNFWVTLPHGKIYVLIVTNKGFGYILGDFLNKLIWSP
jgi:hypothetical protein